jgi:DNA-binding winged helix-turn-helix (wHTH) protein
VASGSYRFDRFTLDPHERQLRDGSKLVDINSRYLDALALLVREQGRLVSKERFLDEVWRGVPVTDEALTQCIKTLRRQLGDDAARPHFIETVPKHGYRFIAPVSVADSGTPVAAKLENRAGRSWQYFLLLGAGGAIGGGMAGLIGGLIYGFAGASQPLQPGMGAISVLLVLLCLTILVALIGGIGVAFGIALAGRLTRYWGPWSIAGGAAGGLIVGALTKLLGIDAFNLLFGQSPGDITGAMEGLIVGAAAGLGAWLAARPGGMPRLRRGMALTAVTGGIAGALIPLLGGKLMAGSLALLAGSVPNSRLRLDRIGHLFGESDFGPVSQIVTGALECGLFAACLVGAMILARRSLAEVA